MFRIPHEAIKREPMTLITMAAIMGGTTAGATAYSASKEAKSAKQATQSQENIAREQMAQSAKTEEMAQKTATTKLKAAQARKSKTILTSPDLEPANVNKATAMGVQ